VVRHLGQLQAQRLAQESKKLGGAARLDLTLKGLATDDGELRLSKLGRETKMGGEQCLVQSRRVHDGAPVTARVRGEGRDRARIVVARCHTTTDTTQHHLDLVVHPTSSETTWRPREPNSCSAGLNRAARAAASSRSRWSASAWITSSAAAAFLTTSGRTSPSAAPGMFAANRHSSRAASGRTSSMRSMYSATLMAEVR